VLLTVTSASREHLLSLMIAHCYLLTDREIEAEGALLIHVTQQSQGPNQSPAAKRPLKLLSLVWPLDEGPGQEARAVPTHPCPVRQNPS
jgi:hypothetical protein